MSTPLLFDAFCGAGGCGEGYARAGFRVVGCDINPKPLRHNPHECYEGDALTVLDTLLDGRLWHGYRLTDFAVIHASPPCQDYSTANSWTWPGRDRKAHPRLIGPTRTRLESTGLPWVLENVRLAMSEMLHPVMLCGTSLSLRVQRHRLFDASIHLFAAGRCNHRPYDVSVRRHRNDYLGVNIPHVLKDGRVVGRKPFCPLPVAKEAMGIDWMTMEELGEAIPPAYTEFLGHQLMTALRHEGRVA